MSSDIKTVEMTIAVPPRRLGYERKSIEDRLNALVSEYVPQADGVLVKWSDLEVLNNMGIIIDDQPYTFWKTRFTAHVFRPVEGKLVRGKVHIILKRYFTVKAIESFSATVTVPEELLEHRVIRNLTVDQEVYFRFKGLTDGAYRGELDNECLELTVKIMEQMDLDDNVYGYAKDFEY